MPVTAPRLDDLDFAAVETMLRERIPLVAPDWTDHNDSDPGITLIQLFAYLAEQVGYRLNRVPEKTYVEFLRLVGVMLDPAKPASTRMAFALAKPEIAEGVLIAAGTRITAKAPQSPVFETDAPLDVLPAQIAALVTVRDGLLDINAGDHGPAAAGTDPATYVNEHFSLAWDGKSPKLKDIPTQPVQIFCKASEASHRSLYIGLAFNRSLSAGFKGARATLHLQIDEDEVPEAGAAVEAGAAPLSVVNAFQGPQLVTYSWYRPPGAGIATGKWESLAVIADDTEAWTRSGAIRFDVPLKIDPIPQGSWIDVEPGLAHPLVGKLKTPVDGAPADVPVSGWLRVTFAVPPKIALRSLNFNTTIASNLKTVTGERIGRGNGKPGQTYALAQRNIASGSLSLVSRDAANAIHPWTEVQDFDTAGPNDLVFVLDAEAGVVIFGDGLHGRPPIATELLIAASYRNGGGLAGEVATGAVSQPSGLPAAVTSAFNVTPARGGHDAETLDAAKARAPHAFRARGRAVTAADYVDAAVAAPGVRIARASVVPLRRPYPLNHLVAGLTAPGVDVETEVPGALTVIVVPNKPGPYPMPPTGELTAVAQHLDSIRLITTEVHVTTPQYVRLHDLRVVVRALPGYTQTLLREAVGDALLRRFHVLTGGTDGTGTPFGGVLHHADLVAAVMRVPGVDRVENLSCLADGRTPDGAVPVMNWRIERRKTMRLTNCPKPGAAEDTDYLLLLADEVPFFDPASITVQISGAP
ncbi:hypothetical protein V1283_003347 [Bradyrhizobium sp. AZCC 2262]|uniref:putative baseplate assembly protein n=1 Tax=Bradyrhizobium sp. AZCC 2262 TaxID=3117022 RepID=UPI002FEE735A